MQDTAALRHLMDRAGFRRILAACPDWEPPAGGVRKIYLHVDVLNAHNIPAVVLHEKKGFRCWWFEHTTPLTSLEELGSPRPGDIILVPELQSWRFMVSTPGAPKVVFNQNVYMLFKNPTDPVKDLVAPYNHPDFLATLVVSEDSRRYINYGFPNHPVFRLHYSVDPKLFYNQQHKKRQIALMPRKKAEDVSQVMDLLAFRKRLENVSVVQIDKFTEQQTANALRESQVFLSLSTYEGFGLPALEAMACGCVVIGYHGRGGAEFLNDQHAFPIEAEDVVGFAARIELVLAELLVDPAPLLGKANKASEFALSTYTPKREQEDILSAWSEIFQIAIARRIAGDSDRSC